MAGETKERVQTGGAPAAIGPYSQAIVTGNLIFCSGQVALDPATGQLAADEVGAQTRQAMNNLQAVLEAAGSGLGNVVKTTVFLTDLADFAAMNAVYGEYFGDMPPARSTVQVAGLPRSARVEIECIAMRPST